MALFPTLVHLAVKATDLQLALLNEVVLLGVEVDLLLFNIARILANSVVGRGEKA